MLAVAGCTAQSVMSPKPLLVWNVTASAPIGLYRRIFGNVQTGDWALVHPPEEIAAFAAQRGYLARNVPMVKRIEAIGGDTVCRHDDTVSINGRVRAIALVRDKAGRPLPVWQGCARLNDEQFFVLTKPPDSFDSRYFGAVPRLNLIERIAPLWTF